MICGMNPFASLDGYMTENGHQTKKANKRRVSEIEVQETDSDVLNSRFGSWKIKSKK
ncbi:MAG: hypothetical protein WCR67_05770 [Bacilli bacterium]